MNFKLRAASRLATAVTTELPLSRMARQFFRAMPAVPKIPQRSLVMGFLIHPLPLEFQDKTASRMGRVLGAGSSLPAECSSATSSRTRAQSLW